MLKTFNSFIKYYTYFNKKNMDEFSLLSSFKYAAQFSTSKNTKNHPNDLKSFALNKDQLSLLTQLRYNSSKLTQTEENENNSKFQVKPPKGTRDFYPHQMAIRRKVLQVISDIFRKHGAVELDTPVFELKEVLTGKYGEDSKLIFDLQDQGGEKCSLRYDLTVPFARFMANNTNIKNIKRFHIGKLYRRDQPVMTKGRFRQFTQCDFDIAGKYDPMIPDAEVLVVMQEILQALDVKDYIVKVNHRKILEAMIETSGADLSLFKTICSSIDKLDKQPWNEVKQELVKQKGISEKSANIIGKLTNYKGNTNQTLQKLLKENPFQGRGKQALADMELLFKYLNAFEMNDKVTFDLSLARGLDYYTGLIYEIVLTDSTLGIGSISGGGRYDDLIGMFSQNQIPSVGGSIGLERLFSILEQKYKNKVKTNECSVLVATVGPVKAEDKLRILGKLWKANIKAETLYVEKVKADKQINHAFDNQIPFILWIGQTQLQTGQFNLKILYKHEQVKVPLQGLGEAVQKYVSEFQEDYKKGNVKFQAPPKKQAGGKKQKQQ